MRKITEMTESNGDNIQRRDFLNGMLYTAGLTMMPSLLLAQDQGIESAQEYFLQRGITEADPRYYPPALTGMRGNHPGSFEAAHKMRDEGGLREGAVKDTGETYDVVVVGGGISGLSAAYFYRKAKPDARVLIIENHDDFGGHAKRNEFRPKGADGPLLIGYGGTQSIEVLRAYTEVSMGLLHELGIDVKKFDTSFYDHGFRSRNGMSHCVFFDKETFGRDVLLQEGKPDWPTFIEMTPLNPQAKKDVLRIQTGDVDYLPGLSEEQKVAKLSRISFKTFLLDVAKCDPQVATYFQRITEGGLCTGIDAADAYSVICFGVKRPEEEFLCDITGALAKGLKLNVPALNEPYIYHFPDGNASIARLLVRKLIPGAAPGSTMEDIVTARFDYSKLDRPDNMVRIRLNSTVVRARNTGTRQNKGVEIIYMREGAAHRVRAVGCVMACWNAVIPYLCPEMPGAQKAALKESVKGALTYTNVLVRNWKAVKAAGMMTSYCPGPSCYFTEVYMDFPVSIGAYRYTASPDDPAILHLVRVPTRPGLRNVDQFRAARYELLATPFSKFEQEASRQLDAMFGPYGFDSSRDIQAITVNRWSHGYARTASTLTDPDWTPENQPNVIGRQPFGRITIANSDSGWFPATQVAIDQAHRAVFELLA